MMRMHCLRIVLKIILKLCPILAFLYSLIVIIITLYINEKAAPLFIFFCVQAYLNWYSVYTISCKAETVNMKDAGPHNTMMYNKITSNIQQYRDSNARFWYCEKCNSYTCKPTQHCLFCNKCFHFRDHHCFFLGACVLRRNMGNFILFCFYTSLTCMYSICILGPYLYKNFNHMIKTDTDSFNIFLNFCFPVAFVRLLYSRENTCVLLVTMFDILVSIFCICLVYGVWKLRSCLSGTQRYANIMRRQSLKEIFGCYGLSNIIFPYNGLIGTKDIDGKYELKEV